MQATTDNNSKAKVYLLIIFLVLAAMANAQDKPKCKGMTKAGINCKSFVMPKTDFCRVHSPNLQRCGTIKADKKPCRNIVGQPGLKCHYHND